MTANTTAAAKAKKTTSPTKKTDIAAPADLLGATAKQMEATFEDGVKAMKDHFSTFTVDTADFKIAAEESAKLLDQTRGATVDGITAFSRELTDFLEKYTEASSDGLKALLAAKSPVEAMEVENRYLMDAASLYVAHLQRLHTLGVEAMAKAWEPLADGASPFSWWKKAA